MTIDLSDGTRWRKIFEQIYFAEPIGGQRNKFRPIPLVIVPTFLDTHIIAVTVFNQQSKPTWSLGGRVFQLIQVSDQSDLGIFRPNKVYSLFINNTSSITFDKLSPTYRVGIQIPKWFIEAYVNVWQYIGSEEFSTIEDKLSDIDTTLNQVNSKVDTLLNA